MEGLPDIVKPIPPSTVEAYEHSREIRLPEELDDLLADPDEMRMQALLIRERILGMAVASVLYSIAFYTPGMVCIHIQGSTQK